MARFGRTQPVNFVYSDDISFGNTVDLLGVGAAAHAGAGAFNLVANLAGTGATAQDAPDVLLIPVPPVPGYTNWYDADDTASIFFDVAAFMLWRDKADNANDLTVVGAVPTSGTRNINGRNVLDFELGQFVSTTEIPLAGNTCTLFAVVQKDSGNRLISFTDGSQADWDNTAGIAYVDFNDDGTYYNGAQVVSGAHPVFDTATPTLYTVQRNSTIWSGRANGVALTGGTSVDTAFNASHLGVGGFPDGSFFGDGAVGEIIIYDTVLTAPQIATVETYLTTKWFPASPVQIAGTGTNASQGRADLTVTQAFAGMGSAAATAPNARLVLAVSFTGTGTDSAGAQAPLSLAANFAGHGDAADAGVGVFTATVNHVIDFAGRGAAAHAGPGSIGVAADLEGAGTSAAASRADLILAATLTGIGTVSAASQATLDLAVSLTGTGANAAQTPNADLKNRANLASTVGTAASTRADLGLIADLEGSGTASSAATDARLFYGIGLTGAGAGSSAGTGQLQYAFALMGFAAAAAASPTALLSLVIFIAGRGSASSAGFAPIFKVLPDLTPAALTIQDEGHTATIWDRGHTATLTPNG